MQFNSDEYLLLSRRGSVPLPVRQRSPGAVWPEPCREPRPERVGSRRRSAARHSLGRRMAAVRALRGGVQAVWTAFGPGGQDL